MIYLIIVVFILVFVLANVPIKYPKCNKKCNTNYYMPGYLDSMYYECPEHGDINKLNNN